MTDSKMLLLTSFAAIAAITFACDRPTAKAPAAAVDVVEGNALDTEASVDGGLEAASSATTDPLAGVIQKKARAINLSVSGAEHLHPNDRVDLVAVLQDSDSEEPYAVTLMQKVRVLSLGPEMPHSTDCTVPLRSVTFLMLPEEGEMALAAETLGQGHLRVILRNPEDPGIQEEIGRATVETILHRALAQKALLKRQASFHDFKYPVSNQAPPVRLSTGIQQGGRAFSVVVIGADMVHQMDRVDLMLSIKHPPSIDRMTITLLQRVIVLALGAKTKDGPTGANFPLRRVTLLVLPEEAELLALADQIGQLQVSLRNSEDIDIEEERGRTTFRTVLTGERLRALRKSRTTTNPCGCVRNGREESGREEQVLIEVPEAPVLRLSK